MSTCVLSELDIFAKPLYQTSVLSSKWVQYLPTTDYEKGGLPISVNIVGSNQDYVDLSNIYLGMKVSIKKGDVYLKDDQKCGPVNNFFHSVFKQIVIKVNDKVITQSSTTYPYRAYIENLLNYGAESKKTHLQTVMFVKDESSKLENFLIANRSENNVVVETPNPGFINRRKNFLNQKCEMYGRLHCDFFNIDKYLLNNINIEVILHKSDDSFSLMGDTGFKVEISDLYLNVRKVKIAPEVILAQAMALEKGNAKYYMDRIVVEAKSIKKESVEHTFENISKGPIPKRLIIGLVDTLAFSGKNNKNPFNFQHFNISEINIAIDGEQLPYQPINFDFEKNQFIQGYYSLVNSNDLSVIKSGNDITMDDYKNGYTLFAFDLAPDSCQNNHNLDQFGSLKLKFTFKQELPCNVTVILYHEYNSTLEIDKLRDIKYDVIG